MYNITGVLRKVTKDPSKNYRRTENAKKNRRHLGDSFTKSLNTKLSAGVLWILPVSQHLRKVRYYCCEKISTCNNQLFFCTFPFMNIYDHQH